MQTSWAAASPSVSESKPDYERIRVPGRCRTRRQWKRKDLVHVTGSSISVQSDHPFRFQMDGDPPGVVHELESPDAAGQHEVPTRILNVAIKPAQTGASWETEEFLKRVSNSELLDLIQHAEDTILVLEDGRQLGGHHRIAELAKRVADGRIPADTQIRLTWFGGR